MIPLDEARAFVLAGCAPAAPVRVALADALGCVAATAIAAAELVPPFANTAVDGYAVQAADVATVPVTLTVLDTVRAGMSGLDTPVVPGGAVRIMTGAPVPPGADAVVMVEDTEGSPTSASVVITASVAAGANIRPAGDDVHPGDEVLAAGTELRAAHLGVLATIGVTELEVVPRPRVGVLSTGDELVGDGAPLAPGQIRDSNRLGLLATLRTYGYDPIDLGLVRDDETAIDRALRDGAARCDALVTTGGVSMGDYDYIKVVLDRIGAMRWMQVAIKPAKPLAFGILDAGDGRLVPVFGLPGNPVSSLVSFELFCRPGLRRMSGHDAADLDGPIIDGVLDEPLRRRPDGKTHFARVRCAWDPATATYRVRSAGAQGSHHMAAMAAADGLAELPDGGPLEAGAGVRVRLLRP